MYEGTALEEYMKEVRVQVCAHCIEHPPEGPPCAPHGKRCGVELHLEKLVGLVHETKSKKIDPYIEAFHQDVCTVCPNRPTDQCPCALEYLLMLAVQAIETVDERRSAGQSV